MRVLRNPLLGQVSSSEPPWFKTILQKLRVCTQTRTQIHPLGQVKKWYSINFRTCTFSANASISTSLDFVTKELNQFVLRLVLSMRSTLDSTCLSVQVLVERIELVSVSCLCQTYYEETFSVQSIMWTTSTTKAVEVRGSKDVLAKIGITGLWKRDACCVCV